MTPSKIIIYITLIWSFLYAVSYANWTWKKKNKLGAVMIYIVAIASVALPIYSIYFRT